MSDHITTLLLMLALFQVKHLFADYFLQTQAMLSARAIYLHAGRAQHAALHAVGSVLVMAPLGVSWGLVCLLALAELVIHFHIDFAKGWWSDRTGFETTDAGYWRAFGVDQLAHQLTYVAMLWCVFQ